MKLLFITSKKQKLIKLLTKFDTLRNPIAIENVSKVGHVQLCKNEFKYVENI